MVVESSRRARRTGTGVEANHSLTTSGSSAAEATNNGISGIEGMSVGRRGLTGCGQSSASHSAANSTVLPTTAMPANQHLPYSSSSPSTAQQQTGIPNPLAPAEATNNCSDGNEKPSAQQRITTNETNAKHKESSRFVRDTNCSCESCTMRSSGVGVTKWANSEAKSHLQEVLSGDKTHTHSYWNDPPGKVYDDNKSLFHLYKFSNFSNNLRTLRKGLLSDQEKTEFDEIAVEHESKAFPRPSVTSHGNPYYDTSETKKLLVKYAEDGTLEQYKHHPRDLKSSNPIFDEYSNKKFVKHYNREKRRVKEVAGWQWTRNLKGSRKQNSKYENVQV